MRWEKKFDEWFWRQPLEIQFLVAVSPLLFVATVILLSIFVIYAF